MRFVPTILLAYLVLGIESGIAPFIGIKSATPNLLLPVVIFIALYAPRDAALLGTYVIGLMQDMLSQEPLGVHALVYGAVTFAVRLTQPTIHREHPMTHILLAVVGGGLQGVVLILVALRLPPRPPISMLMISTLYTAALSPIILRVLHKMKRFFAFQPERKVPGRM